jgi:flavin-binding protein dodecin
MTTIYQLMIDDSQIGDVYYNENDAVDNAIQLAVDTKESVVVWEVEEIDDVPYDVLEWTISRVVWV